MINIKKIAGMNCQMLLLFLCCTQSNISVKYTYIDETESDWSVYGQITVKKEGIRWGIRTFQWRKYRLTFLPVLLSHWFPFLFQWDMRRYPDCRRCMGFTDRFFRYWYSDCFPLRSNSYSVWMRLRLPACRKHILFTIIYRK